MIRACFNPEIDLKATKMAFMANSPCGIFSKVVFMLVPMDDYYPLSLVSHLLFDIPRDISSHLCKSSLIFKPLIALTSEIWRNHIWRENKNMLTVYWGSACFRDFATIFFASWQKIRENSKVSFLPVTFSYCRLTHTQKHPNRQSMTPHWDRYVGASYKIVFFTFGLHSGMEYWYVSGRIETENCYCEHRK